MTNNLIYKERDSAVLTAKNCESIIQNWTHSHHKLNKIINVQIPEQCEKILGGELDDAFEIFKKIEKEPNFLTPTELVKYFKSSLSVVPLLTKA